jgi:predicted secreted protein
MGITSAIVLFAVCWFMTFFIVLPIRVQTQGDLGKIEPGTHAGAPEVHNLKKKAKITTAIAFVIWAILTSIILSGKVSVRDLDFFDKMGPPRSQSETGG